MQFPEPGRGISARFALHTNPADAHARAAGVRARLISEVPELSSGDAVGLQAKHLRRLFELYDTAFFDNALQQRLATRGALLDFGFANRLRTSAGRTLMHAPIAGQPQRFTIELAPAPLLRTFAAGARTADSRVAGTRTVTVNGRPCADRLDAAMRVFEHELIHLLEFLVFDESDCGGERFAYFAHRMFGHSETTHRLTTASEYATTAFGLAPGARVAFEHGGVERIGMLNRVTKRATVLVPDAEGHLYSDGQRYRKFYVPLESLEARPG